MAFQIRNRWTDAVIFECELDAETMNRHISVQLGFAIKKAVADGASLQNSNLSYADLRDADLHDVDFSRADLSYANFSRVDLSYVNFSGADLSYANFSEAEVGYANLRDAYLDNADLQYFKSDMIAEILKMPTELDALREAIVYGRIDGSSYYGECACLAGTLAKNYPGFLELQRHSQNIHIRGTSLQFSVSEKSPREKWFTMIKVGDTPETNQAAKLALEWLDEAIAIRDNIRALAGAA